MEGGEEETGQEGDEDGEEEVGPPPLRLTGQLGGGEVVSLMGHGAFLPWHWPTGEWSTRKPRLLLVTRTITQMKILILPTTRTSLHCTVSSFQLLSSQELIDPLSFNFALSTFVQYLENSVGLCF